MKNPVVFAIALATALIVGCAGAVGPVEIGQPAPEFSLTNRRGQEFSLETPRSNPLVVVFPHAEHRQDTRAWFQSLPADSLNCQVIAIASLGNRESGRRRGGPGGGPPGGGQGGPPGGGMGAPPSGGAPPDGGAPPGGGMQSERGSRSSEDGDSSSSEGRRSRRERVLMFFDRSGNVTKAWLGEDVNQTAVVVVSTDNVVRHIAHGSPNIIVVQQLIDVVNELNAGSAEEPAQ